MDPHATVQLVAICRLQMPVLSDISGHPLLVRYGEQMQFVWAHRARRLAVVVRFFLRWFD